MKENDSDYKIEKIGVLLPSKERKEKEENEDLKFTIERNISSTNYDKSIKIILLGDSSVGKSSIIHYLCKGYFNENIGTTVSIESYNYIIKINNFTIRMQIWDTAGQERFDSIVTNYYHSTDYGIFVYSIGDEKSFNNIENWLKKAQEKNTQKDNKMKSILLGNKKDLDQIKRNVSYNNGQQFAEKNNFMLFKEISCKDDDNKIILEIFDEIAKDYYINNKLNKESTEENDSMFYEASSSILDMSVREEKKKRKCC
jgi:small GTP-binding protein